MPFDEEEDETLNNDKKNTGLKKVSSKKSIFENQPKKPSTADFEKKVDNIQQRALGQQKVAVDLSTKFIKNIEDKTLKQNKTVFAKEIEKELLINLINFGIESNNDPTEERDGMGSISLSAIIFNVLIRQRDRINELEYELSDLKKKISQSTIIELINKQISDLDSKKKAE